MYLRSKLRLQTIFVVIFLSVTSGGIGLFYTHSVANISMVLVETEAVPILKIKGLENLTLEIWLRLILHSSVTDMDTMERIEQEIPRLEQELNTRMEPIAKQYLMPTTNPAMIQQWQQFQKSWEYFHEIIHQVIRLSQEYEKKEAMQIVLSGDGWTTYQQITDSLSALIEGHQQSMETLRDTAVHAKQRADWAITILTAIVGLVTLLLITRLIRQLINPMVQINTHLKALSRGKLVKEDITYRSIDEIGEIARSTQQLKNSIKATIAQANAIATGNYSTEIKLLSNEDQLGQALIDMTYALQQATTQKIRQDWIKTGQTQLNDCISGEQNILHLAENIINFITPYLEAQVGAFYLYQEADEEQIAKLNMIASHAYVWRKNAAHEFKIGEGIVGQAGLERKLFVITQAPQDYIAISSGLGEASPTAILVAPFLYEDRLKGVIELAAFSAFTELQLEFLNQVLSTVAIAINTAESRTQMQALLEKSQAQAEALQTQQRDLQQSNEKLTVQTEELQAQQEELQAQQEELRQINEELEIRTRDLEHQRAAIQEKNQDLERARADLQTKAEELELASKYKSEFLANMSHELRTPLNSLLILAQLLADNKDENLTETQLKYAQTIHNAGSDLLSLINDILDLSKVEAGKIEVHPEELIFTDLIDSLEQKFHHLAQEKGIGFSIQIADDLPTTMYTDPQRLVQVITNLLSNAFKFTQQGQVTLNIQRPTSSTDLSRSKLNPLTSIAISVTDTGIGIPQEKQKVIFEAFQQADGTTNRRYGGTGLGLSISRQLVQLLGGEIQLHSEPDQGSTFSCYLPERIRSNPSQHNHPPQFVQSHQEATSSSTNSTPSQTTAVTVEPIPEPEDDRHDLTPHDKSLLIIEDDRQFAQVLMELAHEKHFKCILAQDGSAGLQLAEAYQPQAIILDIGLPQVDGWTVMEQLKNNPNTRHIPVHFVSGTDESKDARNMGAIGYCLKPVSMAELGEAFKQIETFITKTVKKLLVIVDNPQRQQAILQLISGEDIQPTLVSTEVEAQQQLQIEQFDCVVLDVSVEHDSGLQWLEQLYKEPHLAQLPVIIYAERDLTSAEEVILQKCADILTIKKVYSPERFLDEATLFLHQVESQLPQEHQQLLHKVRDKEAILAGKQVLIVDDDVRNIFALAATLEDKGMDILTAQNGQAALTVLDEQPRIDLILMDIMMPEMDGYESIRQIRAQARFSKLPIIALTAKAMKGDKAKCIEAGASDYLAKPFDTNKLLSLLRVWLHR